ncbi:RES family NAD+ phosphorylase [Xenorhabdus stockiae]|uniref:RES family NAD+ phosphorylase n=1 Tax=Xenorhabdus stockiae TaxID=351614 RepID=UPI003CF4C95B
MEKKENYSFELEIQNLEDKIATILKNSSLPIYLLSTESLRRWQKKEYPSGINFSFGDGRYNALNDAFRVCYMADNAVSALAESFGRQMHISKNVFIDASVIENSRMCLIRSLRPLYFVDIGLLLGMLHITLDISVGDDYTVTQRVMTCLYHLAKDNADGVRYVSRHFPYGYCYAVWELSGEKRFEDAGMMNLAEYADSEYMPANWEYPDITGEELLESVLQFKIVQL